MNQISALALMHGQYNYASTWSNTNIVSVSRINPIKYKVIITKK